MKWLVYILLALVTGLVACSLFPEFITPFQSWEAWEHDRGNRNVRYSGANYPPVLRAEIPVFVAIVLPPSRLASLLGYHLTMYGYLAESVAGVWPVGNSFHYSPPPSIAAAEFLAIGVPFWFAVFVSLGEAIGWIRRRGKYTHERLPNSA